MNLFLRDAGAPAGSPLLRPGGLHRSQVDRPQAAGAALRAWLDAVAALPLAPDQGRQAQALDALRRRPEEALALEVTLPFCAAHCLCCERQVHVAQPAAVLDAYVADVVAEYAMLVERIGGGRELLRLHLGGGTANELGEAQLAQLVDGLSRHGTLPAEALLSADCDPRRTGWVQLQALQGLGFSELKFGVLDLSPEVQAAIGRSQSARLVEDACDMARESGIACIDLRLMVGLPRQTPARWRETLTRVLAMAPDRVSLARYRHRPELVAGQRDIDASELPDAAAANELVRLAAEALCGAGYRWLGADLFVLDTDALAQAADEGRLRFGLGGYSGQPALPHLGLGAGALSDIDGQLFWNEGTLQAWSTRVRAGELPVTHAAGADAAGAERRAAVESLLCGLRCPKPAPGAATAAGWARLAQQVEAGLLRAEGDVLVVTEQGRWGLPALCGAFAAAAARGAA